jgi:hypothetical protein
MTEPVHDMLTAAGLAPGEHAIDCGYTSADLLVSSRARGITLIGPLLADHSAQARAGGYTAQDFTIDWDHQQVTCPQGATSKTWSPCRPQGKRDAIQFAAATGRACPARGQCTSAVRLGRQLFLRPATSMRPSPPPAPPNPASTGKTATPSAPASKAPSTRPPCVTGIRRARYLGLPKTRLEHNAAAAAINLIRLDAWWTGKPLDRTRATCLQRLNLPQPPECQ